MGSFCTGGEIRFMPVEEDLEKDKYEGEYPFEVPTVTLEGTEELYSPQYGFSWSSEAVELKKENCVIQYMQYSYSELLAEDAEGNIIWLDGRSAPYEDCWDGHYLNKTRSATSYKTVIFDLKNRTKQEIEYSAAEAEPTAMSEYEVVKYVDIVDTDGPEYRNKLIRSIGENKINYENLSEDLKNDIGFNMELVSNCYFNNFIAKMNDSVKDDAAFIKLALMNRSSNLKYLSEKTRDDYDIVLGAVSKNGYALEYASNRLKDNFDIVKAAVRQCGWAICFASERLKTEDKLICIGLLDGDACYHNLPESIRANREYALLAAKYCKNNCNILMHLPESLMSDREIIITALKHGDNYDYLCEEMKCDREVIKTAVSKNINVFLRIPEQFQNDEEIARLAIDNYARCICLLKDEKLIEKLVSEDKSLAYILSNIK